METTIAAISTSLGRGAISIIRMSGKNSLKIACKLFQSKKLDYEKIEPNKLYLGNFFFENNKEKCFMVYFKAPNSYTGEDVVEFQIHGGILLTQKILSCLIEKGALLAKPGEFSQRAFENGKISLDEAEAIIGEINAESDGELKANLNLANGKLKEKILKTQNDLTEILAQIEATLDYPEEDFEQSVKAVIFENIKSIKKDLKKYLSQAENLKYINKGVNIAIVGSPNVGKSSLLNALIGQDKAIVTEIPGTTRDIVNESIFYNGIKFNFIDTAGIRDAEDKVEKIGIEKSQKSIETADIVLCVIDGSKKLQASDKKILEKVKKYNYIIVVNKSDCKREVQQFEQEIQVSAVKEEGVESLKQQIFNKLLTDNIDFNQMMIVNERQAANIKESYLICKEILLKQEESMDIVTMLIKNLWNSLGKITGQCENESIIDLIFSKFCLGK